VINDEVIKNLKIDYEKNYNIIEENTYNFLCKNEEDRKTIINRNIIEITQSSINEFIKTDIFIRGDKEV